MSSINVFNSFLISKSNSTFYGAHYIVLTTFVQTVDNIREIPTFVVPLIYIHYLIEIIAQEQFYENQN